MFCVPLGKLSLQGLLRDNILQKALLHHYNHGCDSVFFPEMLGYWFVRVIVYINDSETFFFFYNYLYLHVNKCIHLKTRVFFSYFSEFIF